MSCLVQHSALGIVGVYNYIYYIWVASYSTSYNTVAVPPILKSLRTFILEIDGEDTFVEKNTKDKSPILKEVLKFKGDEEMVAVKEKKRERIWWGQKEEMGWVWEWY